ncbi:DegV family protein [Chloroflexota bacterium]
MVVKIVTDSTSDISPEVASAFGITVVPVYVRFGDEVYKDGVDISKDDFYQKLLSSPVYPSTSQPTPQDFASAYSNYSEQIDGIVSIHVSAKISGTYNSALQGKKMTNEKCQIEVIDSRFASVGLALVAIAAARAANAGGSLPEIVQETHRAISQVRMLGILNTMKYLVLGGRISNAIISVAKVINVKPLLTFKDGEIVRAGLVRTFTQGFHRLYEFVKSDINIQDLAIAYGGVPDQANLLKTNLSSIIPEEKILLTQLGAGLGAHTGPEVLLIALR